MQFEQGHIYHIYNQGNNRQKIFFERENYLFFLKKIRTYVLPYADILAWCLMPNHFHLMVVVNEVEEPESARVSLRAKPSLSPRSFNQSIGVMLRSYTRAIQKQENISGSLFRKQTKAECIDCLNGIMPSFIQENGIAKISITHPQKQYPQICFDYIHNNPVRAKMVGIAENYEFSSAKDYTGLRNGQLINKTVANKFIDF